MAILIVWMVRMSLTVPTIVWYVISPVPTNNAFIPHGDVMVYVHDVFFNIYIYFVISLYR